MFRQPKLDTNSQIITFFKGSFGIQLYQYTKFNWLIHISPYLPQFVVQLWLQVVGWLTMEWVLTSVRRIAEKRQYKLTCTLDLCRLIKSYLFLWKLKYCKGSQTRSV